MNAITLLAQIKPRSNCSSEEAAKTGRECASVLPEVKANEANVQTGFAILFGIIGAVAVIVIIIAAINLATAEGNPEKISVAKRAIIYAAIGLVIAISAEIIIFTLLGKLGG